MGSVMWSSVVTCDVNYPLINDKLLYYELVTRWKAVITEQFLLIMSLLSMRVIVVVLFIMWLC